jgi:hypothetical protein
MCVVSLLIQWQWGWGEGDRYRLTRLMTEKTETTNQEQFAREVHIELIAKQLRAIYTALVARGAEPADAKRILSQSLSAICVQCGMALGGEELALIASGDDEAIAQSPKLTRIVQSYCARKACVSYFYRLAFRESKGVKWEELWENAAEPGGGSLAEAESPSGPSRSFAQAVVERYGLRRILFASVAMAVALMMLYWRFRTPSWSTAPPKYRVDPTSIQPADR